MKFLVMTPNCSHYSNCILINCLLILTLTDLGYDDKLHPSARSLIGRLEVLIDIYMTMTYKKLYKHI